MCLYNPQFGRVALVFTNMTDVLRVDPRLDDCIEEDISMVFWKKSNAQVFFQQKLVNVF